MDPNVVAEVTDKEPDLGIAFLCPPASIQVQSVLFNTEFDAIERAVASLARSVELARSEGVCSTAVVRYGDSSEFPCLTSAQLDHLRQQYGELLPIEYNPFRENLGTARGHNRIAGRADADFILVINPDVVVSPRCLETLLTEFSREGVGLVEAKQIPIEHPKDYDPVSGVTSWASTACCLVPGALFRKLGGFDASSFFLYCDDVDFSWRVRLAGYKVVFQPAATAFHDKRLTAEGRWRASSAERYYSAEAMLFLAHKWSRPDLVKQHLDWFIHHGDDQMKKAAEYFKGRDAEGKLPAPVDPDHMIGQFVGQFYAPHRYAL